MPAGEVIQEPTGEPGWQESLLYIWHDTRAGIAGFHRLGLEPGAGVGNAFCGVFTEDGLRYRYYLPEDEKPVAVPGTAVCSVGSLTARLDQEPVVEFEDEAVSLSLCFSDFQQHAIQEEMESGEGGFQSTRIASDHYEFTCGVRGTARIGDRFVEVEGLGFRDHSWGVRDWHAIRAQRSCIGTLGPSLSWSTLVMTTPHLGVTSQGVVIRDGVLTMARAVDTVIHLEGDGLTHRGGRCVIDLVDGARLTVDLEVIDAWVYQLRDFLSIEGICRIQLDGRPVDGFCLLEMSNNPRLGTHHPEVAVRAALAEGLSTTSNRTPIRTQGKGEA